MSEFETPHNPRSPINPDQGMPGAKIHGAVEQRIDGLFESLKAPSCFSNSEDRILAVHQLSNLGRVHAAHFWNTGKVEQICELLRAPFISTVEEGQYLHLLCSLLERKSIEKETIHVDTSQAVKTCAEVLFPWVERISSLPVAHTSHADSDFIDVNPVSVRSRLFRNLTRILPENKLLEFSLMTMDREGDAFCKDTRDATLLFVSATTAAGMASRSSDLSIRTAVAETINRLAGRIGSLIAPAASDILIVSPESAPNTPENGRLIALKSNHAHLLSLADRLAINLTA